MAEITTIPVYRDRGFYLPGIIGQPTPKGTLVGSVVIDEDALTFECYAFFCRPMLIGRAGNMRQAISIFASRKGPPRPPSSRFDRYIVQRLTV